MVQIYSQIRKADICCKIAMQRREVGTALSFSNSIWKLLSCNNRPTMHFQNWWAAYSRTLSVSNALVLYAQPLYTLSMHDDRMLVVLDNTSFWSAPHEGAINRKCYGSVISNGDNILVNIIIWIAKYKKKRMTVLKSSAFVCC